MLDEFTVLIATDALSKEKELATKADHSSKPRCGRVAMLNCLLKLWTPFSRKAVTVAVVHPDGVVADSPLDQAEALFLQRIGERSSRGRAHARRPRKSSWRTMRFRLHCAT